MSRKNFGELMKERYGEDFYSRIGKLGGLASRGGGFSGDPELAREAGRKGGLAARRKHPELNFKGKEK